MVIRAVAEMAAEERVVAPVEARVAAGKVEGMEAARAAAVRVGVARAVEDWEAARAVED